MKNFIKLTICLLEDLEFCIAFVIGFMFAVILVTANGFKWWYIIIAVIIALIFNLITEWLLGKVVPDEYIG
jgi:uncharacterized membrane protein (DUF106 family)